MLITAAKQVIYRSVGTEEINGIQAILENLQHIRITFFATIYITIITLCLKIILSKKQYRIQNDVKDKELLSKTVPYLIIALIPFLWYLVLKNHSYLHAFFTYRNMLLLSLGINLFIMEMFKLFIKVKTEKKEDEEI